MITTKSGTIINTNNMKQSTLEDLLDRIEEDCTYTSKQVQEQKDKVKDIDKSIEDFNNNK